jgi:hypothetical protein
MIKTLVRQLKLSLSIVGLASTLLTLCIPSVSSAQYTKLVKRPSDRVSQKGAIIISLENSSIYSATSSSSQVLGSASEGQVLISEKDTGSFFKVYEPFGGVEGYVLKSQWRLFAEDNFGALSQVEGAQGFNYLEGVTRVRSGTESNSALVEVPNGSMLVAFASFDSALAVAAPGFGFVGYVASSDTPEIDKSKLYMLNGGKIVQSVNTGVSETGSKSTSSLSVSLNKDPQLATVLSLIVPGGGHIYSGESVTGIAILGISIGAALLGTSIAIKKEQECIDLLVWSYEDNDCAGESVKYAIAGYTASILAWLYGVTDGGNAARRFNKGKGITISALPADRGALVKMTFRF